MTFEKGGGVGIEWRGLLCVMGFIWLWEGFFFYSRHVEKFVKIVVIIIIIIIRICSEKQ